MDVKELVQKSVDDWNKKDKESFLANFTERSEITAPGGVVLHGLEGVGMLWEIWQGAVPDSHGTISNIFAADRRACCEVTFEGTQTGTLRVGEGSATPATGRHVCVPIAQVHVIDDGRFVTSHLYFDQFGLFTQLGLVSMQGVNSR